MNHIHSTAARCRTLAAPLARAWGWPPVRAPGTSPRPPEPMNRATFRFNDTVDAYALRPVAQVYAEAPLPVRTGVANFFGNIRDVWNGC